MWYELSTILTASFIGSFHCVGMCGGFASLSVHNSKFSFSTAASYHIGRLLTYLGAGVIAWGAAQSVNHFSFMSVTHLNFLCAGILVLSGVCILLRFLGLKLPPFLGRPIASKGMYMYREILKKSPKNPIIFRFLVGLLSTLLPCGWLYTYIAIAATSSHPLMTMSVFWLGTLPGLTSWIAFSDSFLVMFGRFFPGLRAILLIAAGVFAYFQHSPVPHSHTAASCHHRGM